MSEVDLWREIRRLNDAVEYLKAFDVARPVVMLQTPLTSTSWDGDTFSTTAKTLIDLSVVFAGTPSGIKTVLVQIILRDSGSAGGSAYINLGPNNIANNGLEFSCTGLVNNSYARGILIVPCDANGDIYYQIVATGVLSLTAWMKVWGWSKD